MKNKFLEISDIPCDAEKKSDLLKLKRLSRSVLFISVICLLASLFNFAREVKNKMAEKDFVISQQERQYLELRTAYRELEAGKEEETDELKEVCEYYFGK